MKKLISLLIILSTVSFAASSCKELYNDFKSVLEPQMTQLCHDENYPDVMLFDFYIHSDEEGYTQFELAYLPIGEHMFVEGDSNPFKCGADKINRFQNSEDILKMIFLTKDCEEGFKESIGVHTDAIRN